MQKTVKSQNILLIVAALAFLSAGVFVSHLFNDTKPFQRSEYIMGTIFDITSVGNSEKVFADVAIKAFNEIKRIDDLMSRYKEGERGISHQ